MRADAAMTNISNGVQNIIVLLLLHVVGTKMKWKASHSHQCLVLWKNNAVCSPAESLMGDEVSTSHDQFVLPIYKRRGLHFRT